MSWYPAFNLRGDPFSVADYANENFEDYPKIKTEASNKIVSRCLSGTNVVFVGPKGSGKSSSMFVAGSELVEKLGSKNVFYFVGPKNITVIYNDLWDELYGQKELTEFVEKYVVEHHSDWFAGQRCQCWDCGRTAKCKFVYKVENVEDRDVKKFGVEKKIRIPHRTGREMCVEIGHIHDVCLMKRRIVDELFGEKRRLDRTFEEENTKRVYLLDIPDDYLQTNYSGKMTRYVLPRLVDEFLKSGTVVITATDKQYEMMKKDEGLSRIQQQAFPLPSTEELREIYVKRVRNFQQGESESLIFTDDGVNGLLDYSQRIPRRFIQLCSQVLTAMQSEGLTEAARKNFIWKTLDLSVCDAVSELNETEALKLLLPKLRSEGCVWVKVKVIAKRLNDDYKVTVDLKDWGTLSRLGRMLKKEFNLEHRGNPDSEYKVRP